MQKLKGLWIPAEILLDKKLSDKEKIILGLSSFNLPKKLNTVF